MNTTLLLLLLSLSSIFLVAAVAKAISPLQTREALLGFGVPKHMVPPLAAALPVVELALGVCLLPVAWPRAGAAASLALLGVFTGITASQLARGRKIDCRCFGELRPRPIGRRSLVRNAALMVAAGLIAWQGPGGWSISIKHWFWGLPADKSALLALQALTLGLSAAVGALLVHRTRADAAVAGRLAAIEDQLVNVPLATGLPIGALAPAFELPTAEGQLHSLRALLGPGLPLVLLFVHPDCGSCARLLPKVLNWRALHQSRLRFALITTSSARGTTAPEYEALAPLYEQARQVSKGYQARSIPSAVLIRPDGTIGSHLAVGEAAIQRQIDLELSR